MCVTCGCGNTGAAPSLQGEGAHAHRHEHEHEHADGTRHAHAASYLSAPPHARAQHVPAGAMHYRPLGAPAHEHPPQSALRVPGADTHTLQLEARILGKNQAIAERNRSRLQAQCIFALNLMSSPGAGKTTLLERTIRDMRASTPIAVIEGDQETANDAERIRAAGARAVQINTGSGCHLEADMLERAMALLAPPPRSLLLIENVGNLVCPALFDLGEHARAVIFSVTEGEDKPFKYPHMFGAADVVILSKIDLMPHLRFNLAQAIDNARAVNPRLGIFPLSAYTGEGLAAWYDWLRGELAAATAGAVDDNAVETTGNAGAAEGTSENTRAMR